MSDQANDLRQLVGRVSAERQAARPRLLVVAGGKGGVGTTTLAVNLAVSFAVLGRRCVLVDADPAGGNLGLFCDLREQNTIADVLAGRTSLADALEPGPMGLQVLPGAWGSTSLAEAASPAQDRLILQLQGLGSLADLIVLDAGNHVSRWAHRLWQAADAVLVVATPELAAVMDTYAAIKVLAVGDESIPVHAVVNLAADASAADEVYARLRRACLRFLGRHLLEAGSIPRDPLVLTTGRAGEPLVTASPRSPAAREIRSLAGLLALRMKLGGSTSDRPVDHSTSLRQR